MSDLRFMGDLPWWAGVLLGLAAAALVVVWYRREVRGLADWKVRWGMPLLRAAAVWVLVMMLTGPVLHHRESVLQRGRVLVFFDDSPSMGLTDEAMTPARKLLIARRLGWVDAGAVDTTAVELAESLAAARAAALGAADEMGATEQALREAASRLAERVAALSERIGAMTASTAASSSQQGLLLERWNDVAGSNVPTGEALTQVLEREANIVERIERFDSPRNRGDDYLQRLRGYLRPPQSGTYVLWLTSDDESVLYLADDGDVSQKREVARVTTSERSVEVTLEADRIYYVEVLHAEGNGDDYVTVGWRLPDGTQERPIPGERLAPMPRDGGAAPVVGAGAIVRRRFEREIVQPARALSERAIPQQTNEAIDAYRDELATLARRTVGYERWLEATFERYAAERIASGDEAVTATLARFDQATRRQRVERLMLDGDAPVIGPLMQTHDVQLYALRGSEAEAFGTAVDGAAASALPNALPTAGGDAVDATDLGTPVRQRTEAAATRRIDATKPAPQTAAIVISDGQHNDGESPLRVARALGQRQIVVHTIGVGATEPPHDLSVLTVEAPRSVFHEDRVRGEVLLSDAMPAGKAFDVKIEREGKTLWQRRLTTLGSGRRRVAFDFAIRELVAEALGETEAKMDVGALPMAMRVVIEPIEGETRTDNNEAPLDFRAVTRKRRMLIVDGRPRWETRYLRNVVERDGRWAVNTVLVGPAAEHEELRRGEGDGRFPNDEQLLNTYDLVVLGEVSADEFKAEERTWLAEFVGTRGGGMMVIDGRRGRLASWNDTPLAPLLPVRRETEALTAPAEGLRLTDVGARVPQLNLASEAGENAKAWRELRPPRFVAPVVALPGTETLVEAEVGERRVPSVVLRRYGAGRVLYSGSDETWRWRYEVADRYHERYWKQMAEWIMEQPFAVSDDHVMLDVERMVYRPGESASLRVRLRDAEGKPMTDATASAVLWRDGKRAGTYMLDADQSGGGVYRGMTDPLVGGEYEVTVEVTGLPKSAMQARTRFFVRPGGVGELATLTLDEARLREMADAAGGRYWREEQAAELIGALEPLSESVIIDYETHLWRSYAWFIPMMLLLAGEWVLRRRAGLL